MYDVIVVGARCAGSALGLLLARRGYRVMLVDKDTFPSDMPRSTHFIHQRGVACLGRWGLRDKVTATGSPPVSSAFVDFASVRLSGTAPQVDGEREAFAPRRLALDSLLLEAATKSGARVYEGCRLERLRFEHDHVTGVAARTHNGETIIESAPLVIGADGPNSRVASQVGAREYHQRPALQGTAWRYYDAPLIRDLQVYVRDFEGVYAFPTSGGTLIGANWSMPRFRSVRRDLDAEYGRLVRRVAPHLADELSSSKLADDRLYAGATRSFFRTPSGAGWALLGDAHYKMDPCTAGGISDAFCDAEILFDAIEEAFAGERSLVHAAADYGHRTEQRALPFYEFTCQLATFAPQSPEMLALYEALKNDPAKVSQFLGLLTGATNPESFFTTAIGGP